MAAGVSRLSPEAEARLWRNPCGRRPASAQGAGTLGACLRACSPARWRVDALTGLDPLGLVVPGRRPIPARGPSSSRRPVYPTARLMTGWLRAAGLILERPLFPLGAETGFLAGKAPPWQGPSGLPSQGLTGALQANGQADFGSPGPPAAGALQAP